MRCALLMMGGALNNQSNSALQCSITSLANTPWAVCRAMRRTMSLGIWCARANPSAADVWWKRVRARHPSAHLPSPGRARQIVRKRQNNFDHARRLAKRTMKKLLLFLGEPPRSDGWMDAPAPSHITYTHTPCQAVHALSRNYKILWATRRYKPR